MTEHLQIYCDSKTSLNIFLTVSTPKKAVGTVKIMNTKKLSENAFQNCLKNLSTPKNKEDMNFSKTGTKN